MRERWVGMIARIVLSVILAASFGFITARSVMASDFHSALAAGAMHSLALKSDGTVWAWGQNGNGQLGDGTFTDNNDPLRVLNMDFAVAISAGEGHSLALKSDGTVWAWGRNGNGQLGNGTYTDNNTPVRVMNLDNVVAISAGMSHSLALKSDGTVWAWGQNPYGELGNGSNLDNSVPGRVLNLDNVVAISAGGYHSLALKSDGTVWAWGSNDLGQLGNQDYESASNVPVQVLYSEGLPLTRIGAISAGYLHSLALMSDGTVWAWGSNDAGQLGSGSTAQFSQVPVPVVYFEGDTVPVTGFVSISAGYAHSLALKIDGSLHAWGWNDYGQLGNGISSGGNSNFPIPVLESSPNIPIKRVVAFSAGMWHSLALKSDGSVWAWGANTSGQLGTGNWGEPNNPLPLRTKFDLGGTPPGAISVSAGGEHSLALTSDNTVWAWGSNNRGQLGNGKNENSNLPVKVIDYIGGSPLAGVKAIAAGGDHSLALKSDGTVWAWGWNGYGQLGNKTYIDNNLPAEVQVNNGGRLNWIKAISAGTIHSLALSDTGAVYAWGGNSFGQVGLPATSLQIPDAIYVKRDGYPLFDIVAISAGGFHSLALASDGTVWAWGRNDYGQLGSGDNTSRYSPRLVVKDVTGASPLTGIVAIAAGTYHSLALASDGTVWAWGQNQDGELGIGYISSFSNIPVKVINRSGTLPFDNAKSISSGRSFSGALSSDGIVWNWGTYYTVVPLAVSVETNGGPGEYLKHIFDISAGRFHSLALKSDGTVWAWGSNFYGQLGNLSNTGKDWAVPVCFNADLVVQDIRFIPDPPPPTVPLDVTVSVKNQGNRDAIGPIRIDVFKHSINPPGATDGDVWCQIDGLLAGEEKTCTGSTAITYPIDNTYTVWAVIDKGNDIPDCNKSNNLFSKRVDVRSDGIDLAVTWLSNPTTAEPGDIIEVGDTTRNMGKVLIMEVSRISTGYYLSSDTVWDANDNLVGSRTLTKNLPFGTDNTGTMNITIPVTQSLGNYYLLACADHEKKLEETNEENNCTYKPIVVGRPDLIVASVGDIPNIVSDRTSITFSDTTRNVGTVPTKSVTHTRYNLIRGEIDEGEFGWRPVGAGLGPNMDNVGSFDLKLQIEEGYYKIRVCANAIIPANPINPVIEMPNGQPNCKDSNLFFFTYPDLRISSISEPPANIAPGNQMRVSDTTWNAGRVASRPSVTVYSLSLDPLTTPGRQIGYRNVGTLEASESKYGEASVTINNDFEYGSYYLVACADGSGSNLVIETDDSNNCKWSTRRVTVGKPDLTVSSISKTLPLLGAPIGGRITLNDNTRNIGTIPTPSISYTSYFLSTDRTIGNDIFLGQRAIDAGLRPRAVSSGSLDVTISNSIRSGLYWLLACADKLRGKTNTYIGQINESDENNNCLFSSDQITIDYPNLKMQRVYGVLPPQPLTKNSQFTLWDNVINDSIVPTQVGTDVRYYFSSDNTSFNRDYYIGYRNIPIINPDKSNYGQSLLTVPSLLPGRYNYYIFACVDENNAVKESKEWDSDNCKYHQGNNRITIVVPN